MKFRSLVFLAVVSCAACTPTDVDAHVGQLDVALSASLGGLEYHLTGATLRIDGADAREVSLEGPGNLSLTLPAGPYQLTLLDGWSLMRDRQGAREAVEAQLLSDNPVSLFLGAGGTEQLAFRFGLADGNLLESGQGSLDVGFELADASLPDTGADMDAGAADCAAELRLNELDYDQPGSDDGEFLEVINVASCTASLAGVALEFVNGSSGEVYARVDLEAVGELDSRQLLIVGDEAVLSALAEGVPSAPLPGAGLQNGPDSVRLVAGEQVLDVFGYGEGAPLVEGTPGPEDDGELSLGRCPDGFDTDDNAQDFVTGPPSPGGENAC